MIFQLCETTSAYDQLDARRSRARARKNLDQLRESTDRAVELAERLAPTYGTSHEKFAAGLRGVQINEEVGDREKFAAGLRGVQINEEVGD